jgi:hypothetical protein
LKRIHIIAFQGSHGIPGYENVPLIIEIGHVGVFFPDEPEDRKIYGFRPDQAAIDQYGDDLASLLFEGHSVFGNLQDDTDIFCEAYDLGMKRDEALFQGEQNVDRLIVYRIEHQYNDQDYFVIRDEILSWYNGVTVPSVRYKLPPPTDTCDNCATVFRQFGIESYIDVHRGRLRDYIKLVFKNPSVGSRWNPEGVC